MGRDARCEKNKIVRRTDYLFEVLDDGRVGKNPPGYAVQFL